jgi:Transposase DDE domain
LKIHIAVDIKSKKIISIKVTDEHVHDSKMLPKLVEDIKKSNHISIGKVFVDGAYDINAVFRCLANNGILPCIKVRRNAKVNKKTNYVHRNLSVVSQKKNSLHLSKLSSKNFLQCACGFGIWMA